MRRCAVLLTVLSALGAGLAAAADAPAELPTAAKQALAKKDAAVIQATRRAVSDLTSVMNTETRAGRLASATAVKQKIEELNTELDVLENRPTSKKSDAFLPGVWRMSNGVVLTLDKKNAFTAAGGNFNWSGKWFVDNGKLLLDSGVFRDTYDLPPQREAVDGKPVWQLRGRNAKGEPLFMYKQE